MSVYLIIAVCCAVVILGGWIAVGRDLGRKSGLSGHDKKIQRHHHDN